MIDTPVRFLRQGSTRMSALLPTKETACSPHMCTNSTYRVVSSGNADRLPTFERSIFRITLQNQVHTRSHKHTANPTLQSPFGCAVMRYTYSVSSVRHFAIAVESSAIRSCSFGSAGSNTSIHALVGIVKP